jgi:hypothetical protein
MKTMCTFAGRLLPFATIERPVKDAHTEWYHGYKGGVSVVELLAEKPWVEFKGTPDEMACPWSGHKLSRQRGVILTIDRYVQKKYPLETVLETLEKYRKSRSFNIQSLGTYLRSVDLDVDFLFEETN